MSNQEFTIMTPLQKAAQALIDRWELPTLSIDSEIEALREALDAEVPQVEPTGLRDVVATVCEGWTLPDGARKMLESALWSSPPQPQATTPVLRECWYESKELKVCRKCGQLHDKAIAAQGEKP